MKLAERATLPSEELADQLRERAIEHRNLCAEMIKRIEETLDHWKHEHDVISAFLVRNQLDRDDDMAEAKSEHVNSRARSISEYG